MPSKQSWQKIHSRTCSLFCPEMYLVADFLYPPLGQASLLSITAFLPASSEPEAHRCFRGSYSPKSQKLMRGTGLSHSWSSFPNQIFIASIRQGHRGVKASSQIDFDSDPSLPLPSDCFLDRCITSELQFLYL